MLHLGFNGIRPRPRWWGCDGLSGWMNSQNERLSRCNKSGGFRMMSQGWCTGKHGKTWANTPFKWRMSFILNHEDFIAMLIWQSSVLGWFLWMKIYQLDIERKLQFGDAKGWNPIRTTQVDMWLGGWVDQFIIPLFKTYTNNNHLFFSSLGFLCHQSLEKGKIRKFRGIKIHQGVFQRPDVGILLLLSGDPRYLDQSWWSGIPQRNRWVFDLNVGKHRWKIWKKKASILNSV